MKFTILTLFPNVFNEYLNSSILKNAFNKTDLEIEIVNFRNFSQNKHNKVDDTPYGGGNGMVLSLQPIVSAIKHYKTKNSLVVLLTPSGHLFNNKFVKPLLKFNHIILICGRYEGFDERILNYIDIELSIGDYVLTGGELPALVIIDALVRQMNNVINKNSLLCESFENNLLDYPVYTKPYNFENYVVADQLMSGNHKLIDQFRKEQQIIKTKKNRYDLYIQYLNERNKNEK